MHLGGMGQINPVGSSSVELASASLPSHTLTHPSIHTIFPLLMRPALYMVMSFTPERHQEGMIALAHNCAHALTVLYKYIYIPSYHLP